MDAVGIISDQSFGEYRDSTNINNLYEHVRAPSTEKKKSIIMGIWFIPRIHITSILLFYVI